ncbi:hypothetical protein ET475_06265 [Microbacterium protaetiae]|uniref:Sensor domain-containing protein n=1 Tax=Microbacterium protaetiae TaxID=2509458 RepID=A0A4P6EBP8_9MICO|nr:hypothetical protein [Microbacterium protaetiae]QAY59632.1 hypothetical protein ET475_06265 [Microbacterium protaetiae]
MKHHSLRNTLGTFFAAAGIAVLGGCAASAPMSSPSSMARVSITKYSAVSAHLDYAHGVAALPTTNLDVGAPDFVMAILHAIAVRTDACMQKQGFPAIADEQSWQPYVGDEDRTLGRWSVDYASKYGAAPAPESQPSEVNLLSKGPDFNNAYSACQIKAKTALDEQIQFAQSKNIISTIKWQAFQLATTSPAGKKVITRWHDCAEDAGVVLDPESGGPSTQYSSQGKQAEITAFTADAKCAKSTGAVQEIFTLRAQYESALLDASEAQVAAYKTQRAKVLTQLDDVISGR